MKDQLFLKNGTFIRRVYRRLFAFDLFAYLAYVIAEIADIFIGGYQLGEQAMYAIFVVCPLLSVIEFIGLLLVPGLVTLTAQRMYSSDYQGVCRTAGEALAVSIASGVLLALVLAAVKRPYLYFYGCTGAAAGYASVYYNWIVIYAAVFPPAHCLYELAAVDGDAELGSAGTVFSITSRVFLSVILCRRIGITGIGLSICISSVAGLAIYCIHFLKKSNTIKPQLYFSSGDLKQALVLSAGTFLPSVLFAFTEMLMNRYILKSCGAACVSVYAVMISVITAFDLFAAAGESARNLCAGLFAENNRKELYTVLREALKSLLITCAVFSVFLFTVAPSLPGLYGIENPETKNTTVGAVRIVCLSAIPYGIGLFGASIYSCIKRPALSVIMPVLLNMICALVPAVLLCSFLGFDGIIAARTVCPLLALILFALAAGRLYKGRPFPLYLDPDCRTAESFDFIVNPESISLVTDRAEKSLKEHGYSGIKIPLLIEELYLRIYEKNPGKKIYSELVMIYEQDRVYIYSRDSGVLFNFTDSGNAIESMNSYVLNILLTGIKQTNYTVTTSFNRNGFVFFKNDPPVSGNASAEK